MTRAEFNELGVTEEQYKDMFGEEVVFDDEVTVAETTEFTVEVPEMVETPAEAAEAQTTIEAIVPAEAKAEVIKTGAAMSFANIKAAAEYLSNELNLKLTNTLDGLYKTKRRGSNKNHGYIVTFNEDKTVALAKIEK